MSERKKPYPFDVFEPKWQQIWDERKTFKTGNPGDEGFDASRPKCYVLDMFPYPSGAGLHVGHPEGYTATDIVARFKRMNGFNVLHPMGWDSFGLPAEQYAIKTGQHPAITTFRNIDNFRRQLKMLGFSYDWDREIATTDHEYVRWTQWIFLRLYNSYYNRELKKARPVSELEAQGLTREEIDQRRLAYVAEVAVNWSPDLGTVLANEEVEEWKAKGHHVERRPLRQWMLRITDYAERLIDELEPLDWPESIKLLQRNWIGKSEGAEVDFELGGETITVYTTRPDTLFGATYMVLSPEHPLVDAVTTPERKEAVEQYRAQCASKSDLERTDLSKEKTGVFTGAHAVNPVNGEQIPVWIADYVLMGYGTGAIMAVPAHDERDFEFAGVFGLPVLQVVQPPTEDTDWRGYCGYEGTSVNSGFLTGLPTPEAKEKMILWLEERGKGRRKVNYKLRDWVFSRQRYWGEPIPMISCPKCGWVPVPEDQLPVVLPQVESYEPTDDGESPLSKMTDWVNTTCPCCGGLAKRETDTMPQWAGSSWYYLRYMDPHDANAPVSKEAEAYWGPVDWYNGGMEHTTLHLLYSRFWHKFLYDIGVVHTKEPYAKRTSHGMILGQNPHYVGNVSTEEEKQALIEKYGNQALRPAVKMSKSLGNVVNPDDVVKAYGADTMRLYIMFIGDFEKVATWSDEAVKGSKRFLDRCWNLMDMAKDSEALSEKNEAIIHKTIRKVTQDIDELKMNTAIAALMTMVNEFYANGLTKGDLKMLMLMLSPFAPHMVEEMWELTGYAAKYGKMAMQMSWPKWDESKTVDAQVEMAVQVGGKFKGTVTVPTDSDQETVVAAAMELDKVKKAVDGMSVVKTILVKNKLVNLIVKPAK